MKADLFIFFIIQIWIYKKRICDVVFWYSVLLHFVTYFVCFNASLTGFTHKFLSMDGLRAG